uniref:Uncharacterized protein n=1 Tax=Ditylenchus dipsaci TaxID=166011 RepID=A0A915DF50_9BILA
MFSAAVSNLFVKTLLVVAAACAVTVGVDRSKAIGPCVDEKCPFDFVCVEAECYNKSDTELTMMRMADEAGQ